MREFIEDRIYKIQRQKEHNLEEISYRENTLTCDDVEEYHILSENENKMIDSELVFLESLLKIMAKKYPDTLIKEKSSESIFND